MTENAHRLNRNHAAALTALVVLIVLVLASPFGWDYLLPQLATVPATAWQTIIAGASWIWNNSLMPVLQFIGSIFA